MHRPALLSSSSIEEEEAYSSLISSSSIEVLSPIPPSNNYQESQDSRDKPRIYSSNNYKSKSSRIPPPTAATNGSRQKFARSTVVSGSKILRSQNNNNNERKSANNINTSSAANSPRLRKRQNHQTATTESTPVNNINNKTTATTFCEDETKVQAEEMIRPEVDTPPAPPPAPAGTNQRSGIDANSRSVNNKRKHLKTEAEKVLKDQLSKGKIPPKAKFRADDEISIGEPATSGVNSGNEGARASTRPRATLTEASVTEAENEQLAASFTPVVVKEVSLDEGNSSDINLDPISPLSSLPPRLARGHSVKSASLDHYYRNVAQSVESSPKLQHPHKLFKSSSTNFFQRLSSLRCSLTERRSSSQTKITPHTTNSHAGFFQGISGNSKLLPAPYTIKHSVNLVIPPLLLPPPSRSTGAAPAARRRKRPRRIAPPLGSRKTRRSFSFTDAQFIAQAAYEGDADLIHELYPGFPHGEPIYNLTKPKKPSTTAANHSDKMVKPAFLDRSPVKFSGSAVTSGNKNLTVITVGRSGSISGSINKTKNILILTPCAFLKKSVFCMKYT